MAKARVGVCSVRLLVYIRGWQSWQDSRREVACSCSEPGRADSKGRVMSDEDKTGKKRMLEQTSPSSGGSEPKKRRESDESENDSEIMSDSS